jgi:ATP-binding protein involved in chromosome partitioning
MADDFDIKGQIIDALSALTDPASGKSLLDAHILEGVEVADGVADVKLLFPKGYDKNHRWDLEDAATDAAGAVDGVKEARVRSFVEGAEEAAKAAKQAAAEAPAPDAPAPQAPAATGGAPGGAAGHAHGAPKPAALNGVGRVIAVASGKGGVGKSTVAVNLALALGRLGHRVGLLDIDVYGPSLPILLGINERPNVHGKRIIPLEAQGLKLMSLGFLMDDDTPVIWRGPIVTGIIRQFLQDVDWAGVDYLVVDMPPGTGDAQLSLAQTVPVDGAVVVTTPSDLSLVDAARGLRMFNTLNVDVLGIVENMAYFNWPGANAVRAAAADLPEGPARTAIESALAEHEKIHIFGSGGGRREAARLGTEFLGEIPLDTRVREGGDAGRPIVAAEPTSDVAQAFVELARRVSEAKPLDASAGGQKKSLFSFIKS